MNIAGLDLATTSGLAWMAPDGTITASTFRANVKKNFLDNEKSLDAVREGEIGRKFEDHLTAWLINNEIGYVGIEAPIPSNPVRKKAHINTDANFAGQSITYTEVAGASLAAIFRIYGLEMVAVTTCQRLNIPAVFIGQGTWRKSFLGTGKPREAKKEAMAMCKRLGIECSSMDAAEACGVVFHLNTVLNPYGRRAQDLFKNTG